MTSWLRGKVSGHVRLIHNFVDSDLELVNNAWPHFFGGCELCRPTDAWLLQVGDWESVDIKLGDEVTKYATIPHTGGVLVKKR